MAVFDASTSDIGIVAASLGLDNLATATITFASPTEVRFLIPATGQSFTFTGVALTVGAGGFTGGTVDGITGFAPGGAVTRFTLSGISVSAVVLQGLVTSGDVAGLMGTLFAGNDTITGSPFGDFAGLSAFAGNDTLTGGLGADVLDGGSGFDTASYLTAESGVDARLIAGRGFGGEALGDSYVSIENLSGSNFADVLQGDNGANALLGRAGDDNLNGLGGNDRLSGGAGNDYLVGGIGADILIGGAGTDTASYVNAAARIDARLGLGMGLLGDAAGDSFLGIENLEGSRFDDILQGDGGPNVLTGGAGADNLNGLGGNDTLNAGAGDDYLVGGPGADILIGGTGTDVASYVNAPAGVGVRLIMGMGFGGDAAGDSFLGIEDLTGSIFDDVLQGDNAANVLKGLVGDDNLNGLGGADVIFGGGGDDYLVGGPGADMLHGEGGTDTASYVNAGSGVDVRLIAGTGFAGDAAGDVISGIENLTGSAFDDLLQGDNAANVLIGLVGDDNLNGLGGADVIFGGGGNDYLVGGAGADMLHGEGGTDTASYVNAPARVDARLANGQGFAGDALGDTYTGIENLTGSAFNDFLVGNGFANVLRGGDGNDTILGRRGADQLFGGPGHDKLWVADVQFQRIDGGSGTDRLSLTLSDLRLDLSLASMAPGSVITGIEEIDLGNTDNVLSLNAEQLRNLSDTTDTLTVFGTATDTVFARGAFTAQGGVVIGGVNFERYVDGTAELLVQTGVAVNLTGWQFGGSLDLSAIEAGDGSQGFVLNGVSAGDMSGRSVSFAGDINGDGFDDLIVGAYRDDPNGDDSGASFVVFGYATAITGGSGAFNLSAIESGDGSLGFVLNGVSAGDQSGFSVSSAGDVNGDGYDDLIIGAHGDDPNGAYSGASFVVFGSATDITGGDGVFELADIETGDGSLGFVLNGVSASDRSGHSVSSAGDVNGDGFDDLIIGAPTADPNGDLSGASFVVFGSATDITGGDGVFELSDIETGDGSRGFVLNGRGFYGPPTIGDLSGSSVSSAGDLNGDGLDDLIIGAPGSYNSGSGGSYVVFGSTTDITGGDGVFELSDLETGDGSLGFVLYGEEIDDGTGASVSSAGDINGDGFDDLLVGAPGFNDFLIRVAQTDVYVVFGSATDITGGDGVISLSEIRHGDSSSGFVISGVRSRDGVGSSVSAAGDVNGDGIDDLIFGAPTNDPRYASGQSFVLFGSTTDITGGDGQLALAEIPDADGLLGFALNGVSMNDLSGLSVSSADVNGDGFDDLLVGAPRDDPNGIDSGAAFLVYGSDINSSVTLLGTSGADILNGTAANEIIIGAQGDDTIDSGAGDDLLTGAEGDDLFVFANGDGDDTIRDFGRENDRIDVTDFGFANFAAIQAAATDVGKDMVIALDADDSLTLLGVNISDLLAGDFLI